MSIAKKYDTFPQKKQSNTGTYYKHEIYFSNMAKNGLSKALANDQIVLSGYK